MTEIIKESIVNAKEEVIIHQVNCVGQLGLQAKSIFESYPDAEKSYFATINRIKAMKLNTAHLLGEVNITQVNGKYIINLFTQESVKKRPCDKTVYTRYDAMHTALKEVANFAKEKGFKVAIPLGMGSGASNGLWSKVEKIIEEELKDIEYNYYTRR